MSAPRRNTWRRWLRWLRRDQSGASRQFASNLSKPVTEETLKQPGGVLVADHLKLEAELREIFTKVAFADPTQPGQDGNHDAVVVFPVTTPSAVDTEFAVAHGLGKVPVAWRVVVPALAGYGMVGTLYNNRDPDAVNLYLAVDDAGDVSVTFSLICW